MDVDVRSSCDTNPCEDVARRRLLTRATSLKRHEVPAEESSAASFMHTFLTKRHVLTAGISLALLAIACASPSLLGNRVSAALANLDAADPALLWLAGSCFAAMGLCGALSWRAALRAGGSPLRFTDAAGRYLVGCGVNALAPAHVGSALRIALLGRVVEGGCWTVSGAAAAVGVTRIVWLGVLLALASAGGVLPVWPLFAMLALVAAAAIVAVGARRLRLPLKISQLLAVFRSLASSPRELAIVSGWALLGAAAKVGAAAAVVSAFGVEHPLGAALVLVPAVEISAVLPITPGNVGVSSAAVALALDAQGVDPKLALAIGIAFGAVEWLAGLALGVAGALSLAGPTARPYLRVATAATATVAVALAFGATVVLPAV